MPPTAGTHLEGVIQYEEVSGQNIAARGHLVGLDHTFPAIIGLPALVPFEKRNLHHLLKQPKRNLICSSFLWISRSSQILH